MPKMRHRILVVEDSADARGYLRGLLEPEYMIDEAEDGKKGIEKALATMPDLVISDIMAPGVDGIEMCRVLKTDDRTSHIPVILLSERAGEVSKLKGLETGADDCLVKPLDAKELLVRAKNLIELRDRLRGKYRKQVVLEPAAVPIASADERFLRKLMETIESHMADPALDTEVLAREACMSRMQLNRKLQALTGHSTHEFLRLQRIQRAARLLAAHTGNVTEVVYEVGFTSLSHFARAFREQFGVNPSEYATQYEPASPTGTRTGTSEELERVVEKCLMKVLAERHPRTDELPVDLKDVNGASSSEPKPQGPAATSTRRKRPIVAYALGLLAVVSVVAISLWLLRGGREPSGMPAAVKSLAVLPVRNLTNVPGDELLSDGILEGLITELGKIKSLSTIGRQSVVGYKGTDKTYTQIAAELGGVDAIVEPLFQHVGNKLQIHARLIQASDGTVRWAGVFDKTMDDVLVLQSEVARAIAREIRVLVTPQEQIRLASARRVNVELYNIYLQGRYHFARRTLADFERSTQLFQQVLDKDSDNALAYAGLAESYGILPFYQGALPREAFPKAKAAALKALELDNSLAEAHAALGFVLLYWDWDWSAAEKEFLEAIELKPSYVVAHHWYAEYLSAMGRHEEAIAEIKQAQALDPLSPLMQTIGGGEIYYFARRYDEGIVQCRKALELDPNYALGRAGIALLYSIRGMNDQAYAEAQTSERLVGAKTTLSLTLAYIHAAQGARAKALDILAARRNSRQQELEPAKVAGVYARLGDNDLALDWLEFAYRQRNPRLVFSNVEGKLDPLRSEPRFRDLMRRVGLPSTP